MVIDAGVRLAIGRNQISMKSIDELMNPASYGVLDNGAFLNPSAIAREIFPERRIGSLEDGAEATFLVFTDSPLDDIANIKSIRLPFKDGIVLSNL